MYIRFLFCYVLCQQMANPNQVVSFYVDKFSDFSEGIRTSNPLTFDLYQLQGIFKSIADAMNFCNSLQDQPLRTQILHAIMSLNSEIQRMLLQRINSLQ